MYSVAIQSVQILKNVAVFGFGSMGVWSPTQKLAQFLATKDGGTFEDVEIFV